MRLATFAAIAICISFVGLVEAQKPKPKTRIERQKENDEAFGKLTYAQQRWVVYSKTGAKESGVGWMGVHSWDGWKVLEVESKTDVVMQFRYSRQDDLYAWVSGVDTSRLITDGKLDTGKETFWIPRTKKYGFITMHEYEWIPDTDKIKDITPPKGAKLEDFPPK